MFVNADQPLTLSGILDLNTQKLQRKLPEQYVDGYPQVLFSRKMFTVKQDDPYFQIKKIKINAILNAFFRGNTKLKVQGEITEVRTLVQQIRCPFGIHFEKYDISISIYGKN